MAFNVRELPQILPNIGDRKVFEFVDRRGISFDSPWGVAVPDLEIMCCKTRNSNAKHFKIVNNENFVYFVYDCVCAGASYKQIDDFIFKLTEIRTCTMEYIRKFPELCAEIRKMQVQNHKDSVLNMEDLAGINTPVEAKMAEIKYRSRLNLLSRFDPEFKQKESNISEHLATVILRRKEREEDERDAEELKEMKNIEKL